MAGGETFCGDCDTPLPQPFELSRMSPGARPDVPLVAGVVVEAVQQGATAAAAAAGSWTNRPAGFGEAMAVGTSMVSFQQLYFSLPFAAFARC